MKSKFSENPLTEQAVVDWFKQLGYEYKYSDLIFRRVVILERKEKFQKLFESVLNKSFKGEL